VAAHDQGARVTYLGPRGTQIDPAHVGQKCGNRSSIPDRPGCRAGWLLHCGR
jgi:hypothetical protein